MPLATPTSVEHFIKIDTMMLGWIHRGEPWPFNTPSPSEHHNKPVNQTGNMTKAEREKRIVDLTNNNSLEILKEQAEELQLPTSGTKTDLATRIVESEEKSDDTPSSDALSVESRLARLEQVVHQNYEQFAKHTHHPQSGNVVVSETTDREEAERAGEVSDPALGTEAERRESANARRQSLEASGKIKPGDPLPDDSDDVEGDEEDTNEKEKKG